MPPARQEGRLKRLLAIMLMGCLSSCDYAGETAVAEAEQEDVVLPLPFRVEGNYLAVFEDDAYRPMFIKGMNLGSGVPGKQAGDLEISEDQYARWLSRMGEMGINALRVYTLHYPKFYVALSDYNAAHPGAPIYLFQGIWLDEENPDAEDDLYALTPSFDDAIEETVDCIHGDRIIAHRYGRAYGAYDVNVSNWVMGWIIGREIHPHEVDATNQLHVGDTAFEGLAIRLQEGTPTETWVAARLDKLISYEKDLYGVQRPVSLSSWPTLDPLIHPSEGVASNEDRVSIDLADVALLDAPAGVFYSFHAYPYYPDFMNDEPAYAEYEDDEGVNNYLGYLDALKTHYADRPLVIAEFGVPSSWGNAHYSLSGMHHGGHDEVTQGEFDARQLNNIFDSDCAGGMLFAWMDEWWKRTWITDELDMPRSRFPLWWNITAAEQNFGLIAFAPPAPAYDSLYESSSGRIRHISVAASNPFFHIRIFLNRAPASGTALTVGFDTYRSDVGESILPDGQSTSLRAELALVVEPPDTAQLYVAEAYDLFGIWHGTASVAQRFHSEVSDGGPWNAVRWKNNGARLSSGGDTLYPATEQAIGALRVREGGVFSSNLDGVLLNENEVRIRVPWTLLQVTDPSRMQVMDDDRATPTRETATSDGIALTVSVAGESVETPRFTWPTWDEAPFTAEREKPSLEIFAAAVKDLPGYL